MLEFYFENRARLLQLRCCPIGSTLDGFARWMKSAGYQHRPGQLSLRAAAHVGYWLSAHEVSIANLDDTHVDLFLGHLPACTCSHPFRGRDRYHAQGARQFHSYLRAAGIAPPSIRLVLPPSVPVVEQFCDWMRLHRGVTESTLANYRPLVREFLAALGDAPGSYDASQVRDFIFAVSNKHGEARTRSTVNAVRMFLRFLAVYGHCSTELVAAVPRIARWRLATLPRYIDAASIERLMATCDPTCAAGARDRAIMLLLARLGLRAGDVRELRLGDIDWPQGRLRVMGKGRCENWLPLPQQVGDAIWHYIDQFRSRIDDDHVFLRLHAPSGPLRSSGPISKLVRRAIQRAGIQAPSMGAHVLRHSAATAMLREGVCLDIIGAVLRHRCVESTAHYAKVDAGLLRSIMQPWPEQGDSPC